MALNDIKKQINSISKTAQITNAMQLISTTKYNRISENAKNYQMYSEQIRQAVVSLVQSVSDITLLSSENVTQSEIIQSHDLLIKRPIKKTAYMLITSSQGLAGSYNSSIIKEMEHRLKGKPKEDIVIIGVGQPAVKFARDYGYELVLRRDQISSYPDFVEVQILIRQIVKMYREAAFDQLIICYNHALNVMEVKFEIAQLLPLNAAHLIPHDKAQQSHQEFLVEPDWQSVLDRLLPLYVESQIFGALIDAKSAEYSSRMQAM